MNISSLSLGETPPLWVPIPYFLVAPLYLLAAAVVLGLAPEVLVDRWSPWALAGTHMLTLGFLATAMMGAVQQVLPVLLGVRPLAWRAVAVVVWVSIVLGTGLLIAGFLGSTTTMRWGVTLLAAGLSFFIVSVASALVRSSARGGTRLAMVLSIGALAVTVLLGAYLGAGWAWPTIPLARELTGVHLAWGWAGWIGLLVMGVAYQVIPMFQVAPDYSPWFIRALAPLTVSALLAWSITIILRYPAWPSWIAASALAGFAIATLHVLQRRRRKFPDVTVSFWRMGMFALLATVLLWMVSALHAFPIPDGLLAVAFLLGFAVSVVSGMMYKIIPFLVWLHLNNRARTSGARQGAIPNMKQIIPDRAARFQWRLHVGAVVAAAAASITPAWFAQTAAVLLAMSAMILFWNLASALYLYRQVLESF